MGKLRKFLHYHADRAWEGIWQAIVLWALALGGGPAFVWGLLKRLGASMDIALYAGILFALPAAVVVIFFRRHTKMMAIVKELQAKLPPDSADIKTQPATVPIRRSRIVVMIALGFVVLALVLLALINWSSNTVAPQPAPNIADAGTGPVAIFNGFDEIQRKVLRTLWDQQDRIEYARRWTLPLVRGVPADPQYALPEYIEFRKHLDPLVTQDYINCNYSDKLQNPYCGLTDNGILLMKSVGSVPGPVYLLPRSLVTGN